MRFVRPIFFSMMLCLLVDGQIGSRRANAATEEKSNSVDFQVESTDAVIALETFADQARTPIVYLVKDVQGIRLNEVSGVWSPKEALERMVADTPLWVVEDSERGVLLVKKREPALVAVDQSEPSNPNELRETKQPNNRTKPMKRNEPRKSGGLFGILFSIAAIGGTQTADAQDDGPTYELEKLSVYGSAASDAVARQRESDIIGSYLSADALADLPDDNLGEAISRMAGVNVIGGQGNAEAAVTIRGAVGQYNTIRVNGAAPSNARIGGRVDSNNEAASSRVFDLNQIPSEMVSGVEIIKSITAEHPGDSIGGSVNVETASAFDLGNKSRYKFEWRHREQGSSDGWGTNFVHSRIVDAFGGDDNLGILFNVTFKDEDLAVWGTQNRYYDEPNRFRGSDEETEVFNNLTTLEVNPDASIPIWDRFDPDEGRTSRDQLTFGASFDLKLNERTELFFRPQYQKATETRDNMAFRVDRLERAFRGNFWFLDDSGSPIGSWEDSDEDGILGSEDDTFIRGVDGNGDMIVTPNFEASWDGREAHIVNGRDLESETYTLDFGGETELENGLLEYRAYYSTDDGSDFRRQYRFENRATDRRITDAWRTRFFGTTPLPTFETFEVTSNRGHVPSNNGANLFAEGSVATDASPRFLLVDTAEDVFLTSVDWTQDLSENLTFKTGARWRVSERENVTAEMFLNRSEGSRRTLTIADYAAMGAADGVHEIFDGQYRDIAGPFLLADPVYDFFFDDYAANPGNWVFNRSDLRDAIDTAELREEVFGAYVQGTWKWEDFSLVAGVRNELTDLDTVWKPSNFFVDGRNFPLSQDRKDALEEILQTGVTDRGYNGPTGSFSFGDIVDDIADGNRYDNWLPSVVATYRVPDTGHVFRAAWTNTLTRPDLRELVPFDLELANRQLGAAGVLNLTNREEEFHIGNPDLSEQLSENVDIAWEYYFGPSEGNSISVTYFQKNLDDFLQLDEFTRDVTVLIDDTDPDAGFEEIESEIRFWTNASTRNIKGVEVSGYFNLGDFAPNVPILKDFSFVPNYAKITGDQTNPIFDQDELALGNIVQIGEQITNSLTNQAEEIYNLQLFYEWQRLSVRLSYNYISELQRSPSSAAIDSLEFDAEKQNWDMSVQYRLFPDRDIRLFIEGDNLGDEPSDQRFNGSDPSLYIRRYETIGTRYIFGVRGSF